MNASVKMEEPGVPERADGAGPSSAAPPVSTKAEDDKADAKKAAELQARREYEAEVLKQANEIRDRRAWLRVQPASDGKKGKTHWDHLLDEMVWLSKEFQRERRWKLQQARKVANQVARSNLDLESRVEVRARETEKAIRKRASWIAHEISAFWNKAQRVVQFKVRTEVEAKKKQVLDRQLDVLLGQTQKYSSLLALRLAADERAEAVVAASKAEVAPAPGEQSKQPLVTEEGTVPSAAVRPRVPVSQPTSAAVSGTAPDKDDTRDYRSGEDDDADDEATLEEEERMAQAEGRNLLKDEKEEAAGLEEDADLPLEELLARYGYVVPGNGEAMDIEQPPAGPSTVAPPAGTEDVNSDAESERLDALLRDPEVDAHIPPPPSRLAAAFAELSDEEGAGSVDEDDAGPSRPAATRVMPRTRGGSATPSGAADPSSKPVPPRPSRISTVSGSKCGGKDEEDEYRSGEDDDADDEATLEEEERMAQAEGRNLLKDEKEEAAGLEEDADLPLEELLARYGYVVPGNGESEEPAATGDGAGPSNTAAAATGAARRQTRGTSASAKDPTAPIAAEEIAPEVEPVEASDLGLEGTMEAMAAAQPTGFTLDTTKVKTPVPFLLKGQLREYQHIGLDWLVTLYHRRLNGILADEMGLGKTIQTIALLAWLACERGDWGPHLVVVPTSVMLNWEMEFKRWCPAFKLLTYYGSPKERAAKRQGWSKPNAFHVCITSYTLVLQDARMFKRKKWKYLVLDEAHMIKNWRSQRWQTLLNFNSKRRLLITGTPLQNDLMELWSLMHFLMPQVFGSHAQFKDWFSNPLTGMVEGSAEYNKAIVERLHAVLRPFLLRRLKRDVEKQLPGKHEHVIKCRLSKRQRQLYEEYMASGDTRSTLSSGNFLGIMNCLMQLRKVCNHPDLFEGRAIVSAYDMPALELKMPSTAVDILTTRSSIVSSSLRGGLGGAFNRIASLSSPPIENKATVSTIPTIRWPQAGSLRELGLLPVVDGGEMRNWEVEEIKTLALSSDAFSTPLTTPQEDLALLMGDPSTTGSLLAALRRTPTQTALGAVAASVQALATKRRIWRHERTTALGAMSIARTNRTPDITADFLSAGHIELAVDHVHCIARQKGRHLDYSTTLAEMIKLPERRAAEMEVELREFVFVIPKARAPPPTLWCSHPDSSAVAAAAHRSRALQTTYVEKSELLHIPRLRTQLFFPDKRLLQYDCGKLQELAMLLLKLKAQGSRALIFTQMSKMLDVLEAFLNLHAYTYVRLDGSTKPEQRQILMQRFNTDPKIFCFILSTRSGGVGMNLTGADTVIFYDSDWNPAMDAQAQDRCHRIGQTREVHIYRLVSEHTIEENILKKSDQKRHLDFLAIQSGAFTTDFLTSSKFDPQALLEGTAAVAGREAELQAAMRAAEDEGDAAAAAAAEQEVAAEMDEFIKEPPPGAAATGEGGANGENGGNGDEGAGPSNGDGNDEPSTAGAVPPPADGGTRAAAAAAVAAEDDEGFADVAALAAGGAPGEDPLSHLQSALRPIEKYAVRFVEFEAPAVDADALAAQMEATYKVEEFDVDAIEAAEEEREAEIDDDEEANVVGDWDQDAATAAYAAQVEVAEAEEKEREAAEAAWIAAYEAQYGVLPPLFGGPEPSSLGGSGGGRKSGGTGRGRGRPPAHAAIYAGGSTGTGTGWTMGGDEGGGAHIDTAMSPRAAGALDNGYGYYTNNSTVSKRRRVSTAGPPPHPWEPQEDFVLASVVVLLLESGELPSPAIWSIAADALGAGAAATSVTGIEAASRQGRRRTAEACSTRYRQLQAAYAAATGGEKDNLEAGVATVKAAIGAVLGAAALPGHAADGLATTYATLMKWSSTSPQANMLVEKLHALRGAAAAGGLSAPPPIMLPPGAPEAGPVEQAHAIVAAVRQGCGSGAARVISSRLPSVVQAAKVGSMSNAYGATAPPVAVAGGGTENTLVGGNSAAVFDYGLDGLLASGAIAPADGATLSC